MTTLTDHRLVLVVPLRGATPRGAAWKAVDPDERQRLYLTTDAQRALRHRHALHVPQPWGPESGEVVRAVLVHGATFAHPAPAALGLVLRLRDPSLDALLTAADTWRLQGPWWPGQPLVPWRLGRETFPHLGAVVDHLVHGQRSVEDPRAWTLTYAAFDGDPGRLTRYRLTQSDPPDMAAPPDDLLDDALRRFAYRRWEATGTTWTFCAHGGACVAGQDGVAPQDWLGPLFESVYLDLALWVALVATERRHGVKGELHHQRLTDQDQGRLLARAWLDAIEDDYRDVARKGWTP